MKQRIAATIGLLILSVVLGACNHYSPWRDEYGHVHEQLYCSPYSYQTVNVSSKRKSKAGYSGLSNSHKTGVSYSNVSGEDCYYP